MFGEIIYYSDSIYEATIVNPQGLWEMLLVI